MNPLPGVGRADLLRLLECLGEDGLHHAAGLAGFGCVPEEPETRRRPREAPRAPTHAPAPDPAAAREQRLETPTEAVGGLPFYRVTRRNSVARTRPLGEVPDWYRHARHLPDLDLDPRDLAPPVPAPLTPWRRLWPFLHAALGRIREAQAPDIQRLVGLAARGRLPRRVPRLRRAGWTPQCRLILDLAPRLEPLRADIWGLIRPLVRLRGHLGMQLYAVTAGPEGPWHTPSHREGWCEVPQPAPPPPGTPVLCVGDLGCYGAVAERLAWRRFGEGLRGAGCQPLALMPCPARYWDPGTAGLYRQVVWDRARRLPCRLPGRIAPPYASLAETARTDAAPDASQDPGAERLLDLLAPAVRLEPALLRALRCRLPGMDIGVEMAAWLHPDLAPRELGGEWQGGGTLERRFRGNRTRPMDERLLAAGLLRAMHGYLLPSLRHREGTNLARLLGEDDGGAGDYLADTVLTLQQGYGDRAQRIRRYVLALAEQLPPEAW